VKQKGISLKKIDAVKTNYKARVDNIGAPKRNAESCFEEDVLFLKKTE